MIVVLLLVDCRCCCWWFGSLRWCDRWGLRVACCVKLVKWCLSVALPDTPSTIFNYDPYGSCSRLIDDTLNSINSSFLKKLINSFKIHKPAREARWRFSFREALAAFTKMLEQQQKARIMSYRHRRYSCTLSTPKATSTRTVGPIVSLLLLLLIVILQFLHRQVL
jgi:hypothetical protein